LETLRTEEKMERPKVAAARMPGPRGAAEATG
jgi:hypothetical protein